VCVREEMQSSTGELCASTLRHHLVCIFVLFFTPSRDHCLFRANGFQSICHYAVDSRNLECLQILVGAGASLNYFSRCEEFLFCGQSPSRFCECKFSFVSDFLVSRRRRSVLPLKIATSTSCVLY
jgi:hypothetical protein